jgi:hypothetical protein
MKLKGFKNLRLFKDKVGFRDAQGRPIKIDDVLHDPQDNYLGTVHIRQEFKDMTAAHSNSTVSISGFYIETYLEFGTRQIENCVQTATDNITRLERVT